MKNKMGPLIGILVLCLLLLIVRAASASGRETVADLRKEHEELINLQKRAEESYPEAEKIACKIAAYLAVDCMQDERKCSEAQDTFTWFTSQYGYYDEVCIGIAYDYDAEEYQY